LNTLPQPVSGARESALPALLRFLNTLKMARLRGMMVPAMRQLSLSLIALLVLSACSGTRNTGDTPLPPEKEKLIDALTLFVEAVQGDRFDKALGYLAPEEKAKMTDASGQVPAPVQKQLKALRLSTLASKTGVQLEKGKLTGIFAWLPNIDHLAPNEPPRESAPRIQ
jgi:hypothetical protein